MVLFADFGFLFIYGQPDWEAGGNRLLRIAAARCMPARLRGFYLNVDPQPDCGGSHHVRVCLLLFVLNWTTSFGNSASSQVLSYVSIISHFDSFSRGVIDSKDLIFYLTMIFFGLFLTARSLESLRWRA